MSSSELHTLCLWGQYDLRDLIWPHAAAQGRADNLLAVNHLGWNFNTNILLKVINWFWWQKLVTEFKYQTKLLWQPQLQKKKT